MVKRQYKVLARVTPFNSKKEFIILEPLETSFNDPITLSLSDEGLKIKSDVSEGDKVILDRITFIKKV